MKTQNTENKNTAVVKVEGSNNLVVNELMVRLVDESFKEMDSAEHCIANACQKMYQASTTCAKRSDFVKYVMSVREINKTTVSKMIRSGYMIDKYPALTANDYSYKDMYTISLYETQLSLPDDLLEGGRFFGLRSKALEEALKEAFPKEEKLDKDTSSESSETGESGESTETSGIVEDSNAVDSNINGVDFDDCFNSLNHAVELIKKAIADSPKMSKTTKETLTDAMLVVASVADDLNEIA